MSKMWSMGLQGPWCNDAFKWLRDSVGSIKDYDGSNLLYFMMISNWTGSWRLQPVWPSAGQGLDVPGLVPYPILSISWTQQFIWHLCYKYNMMYSMLTCVQHRKQLMCCFESILRNHWWPWIIKLPFYHSLAFQRICRDMYWLPSKFW